MKSIRFLKYSIYFGQLVHYKENRLIIEYFYFQQQQTIYGPAFLELFTQFFFFNNKVLICNLENGLADCNILTILKNLF